MSQKRARVDSDELDFDSPEVKRLRDDLLSNLDDSDLIITPSLDLDSFMRSFENEISPAPAPAPDSGDLCFLLGASDDELGIPPAGEEGEEEKERVFTESETELWRFEDELPSYDSFEYGDYVYNDIGYEYSGSGLDLYEAPIPLWRPETTPAL